MLTAETAGRTTKTRGKTMNDIKEVSAWRKETAAENIALALEIQAQVKEHVNSRGIDFSTALLAASAISLKDELQGIKNAIGE